MSRNNDLFNVFVGNESLATNEGLADLKPGYIGLFRYDNSNHKDISSDGSESDYDNYFFAAGVGYGTTLTDIRKSPIFSKKNIKSIAATASSNPANMVLQVNGIGSIKCDTDYAIKLEFRNQEIYRLSGYTQLAKTYVARTACCGSGCDPCSPVDPNELVKVFINLINKDRDGLVTAAPYTAAGVLIPDLDAFINTNKATNTDSNLANDIVASIRLTTKPLAMQQFCNVNLRYFKPRQTVIVPSLTAGFECSKAVIATINGGSFGSGSGYDVRQREYVAAAYQGGSPYRVTDLTYGLANRFVYNTDVNKDYYSFHIEVELPSIGGWQEYNNNCAFEVYLASTAANTADFKTSIEALVMNNNDIMLS